MFIDKYRFDPFFPLYKGVRLIETINNEKSSDRGRRHRVKTIVMLAWAIIINLITATSYAKEADPAFRAGIEAFKKGDFAGALPKFKASEEATHESAALFMQCRCMQELDQVNPAVDCYERFVREFPHDEDLGRAQAYVTKHQAPPPPLPAPASVPTSAPPSEDAKTCVLLLREIPQNAEVKVNGKLVDYKVPITTDCFEQRIEVLVAGQQVKGGRVATKRDKVTEWVYEPNTPIDPALLAPKIEEPFLSTQKWVAVGLGGGALVSGILTGVFAGEMSEASDKVRAGQFDFNSKRDWEAAQTRTWIASGTTLALLGAGALVWILDSPAPPQGKKHASGASLSQSGFTILW